MTNDHLWPCYDHRPMHGHVTIMTRPLHDQELTMIWSYNDHPMAITQEEHDHGVMAIWWSFIGNTIITLLSHHICHIHLIILSWQYHIIQYTWLHICCHALVMIMVALMFCFSVTAVAIALSCHSHLKNMMSLASLKKLRATQESYCSRLIQETLTYSMQRRP